MPANIAVRLPSLEDLVAYALRQWECFLLHLMNSNEAERSTNFSSSMMKVFQHGLLTQKDGKEQPRLTESGFQFLLMDSNAQLWYIVREYISNSEERGVDTANLISFLLELSFHNTGEAYNLNTLTDIQRNIIKDLVDLGLVKLQQGRKDSWFVPTKLATNLSISLADSTSRKQGFVVVETNFWMYAYSSSKLHWLSTSSQTSLFVQLRKKACIEHFNMVLLQSRQESPSIVAVLYSVCMSNHLSSVLNFSFVYYSRVLLIETHKQLQGVPSVFPDDNTTDG